MSGAAAPRQASGMANDALAACLDGDPAASRDGDLAAQRSGLLDLTAGRAIVIPGADLMQLANLRYEGPDPDADTISAARYALDMYWYRAGEARRIGGERARGMHYDLCRYLIPFLLEHRGEDGPLQAARLGISDVTTFVQVLAGERPLPAATVAARHQLYGLVAGLGLASRRGMREAILLSADEIQRVRDEVERQAIARSSTMTHSEAAQHLGVPNPLIQTLVRSGVLVAVKSGSQ